MKKISSHLLGPQSNWLAEGDIEEEAELIAGSSSEEKSYKDGKSKKKRKKKRKKKKGKS